MSDQGNLNDNIKKLLKQASVTPAPQVKQSSQYQGKHNSVKQKSTQKVQKNKEITQEQLNKLKEGLVDTNKPSEKVQSLMSQKISFISNNSSQRRVIFKGIKNGLKNDPLNHTQSQQSIFQSVYKQDYLEQDQKRQISLQQLKDQYQMQLQKDNYELQMRKLQQSMQSIQNKQNSQSQKNLLSTQKLPKIKLEDQINKHKQNNQNQNALEIEQSAKNMKQLKNNNNMINVTNNKMQKRSASEHTIIPSDVHLNDAEEFAKKNKKKVKINIENNEQKVNNKEQENKEEKENKEEEKENNENENKQQNNNKEQNEKQQKEEDLNQNQNQQTMENEQEVKSEDNTANTGNNQQEYYNSMTDSLFNGALPSNATESMILDTLLNNPEYYDHKLGRCLCSYCDCGFCQRKCAEINAKLQRPSNTMSWVTSYKKDFSDYQSESSIKTNGIFINRNKSSDLKFSDQSYHDLVSTMRADFKCQNPQKKTSKVDFTHSIKESPFYNVSTYKQGFPNYGGIVMPNLKKKPNLTTHKELPSLVKESANKEYGKFDSNINKEQLYHQKKGLFAKYPHVVESGKREPVNSLLSAYPNAKMDYLIATSKSQYKNPKVYKDLNNISLKQNYSYDKLPSYEGQFKTQNQSEYKPHVHTCKARGKIQQLLKDRLIQKHINHNYSTPQHKHYLSNIDNILMEQLKSPSIDKKSYALGSKAPEYPNHPLYPKRVKIQV